MGHTFLLSDKPIIEHFVHKSKMMCFTEHLNWKKLDGETLHSSGTHTIGGSSPLFHAVGHAFNDHAPLIITPDAVWLTILTGLTHHIDTDPEGLRHHFVQHDGKIELQVDVQSPPMPHVPPQVWEFGVRRFSEKIYGHIGKKADLIVCDFSTTTKSDRLSSQIALMGVMKHYFTYKMCFVCGLTSVTVEGTPDDWANIADRVRALSEFELEWWTSHLLPVVEELKRSCEGNPDIDFWNRIYLKHRFGSGSQFRVSGWVNVFHPYIAGRTGMRRNEVVDWEGSGKANDPEDFPSGLVSAPVILDDHGTEYDFKFYGGLVGIELGEGHSVKPVSGWAIQNLGLAKKE